MITLQHTALYFMALSDVRKDTSHQRLMEEFTKEIPFVLLPDAIRAYIGSRQITHFEENPSKTDTSWIKFPNPETLKELSKENIKEKISCYQAEGYQKCVIGENSNLATFETKNFGHQHYHALRIHLFQDCVMDSFLRTELISHEERFKDQFPLRHNRAIVLNGNQLREQVDKFERIGFVNLARIVYERTGVLLDRAWLDTNVYPALVLAYPRDLADNTYRYMMLDDVTDERLNAHQFEITNDDKAEVSMSFNLEDDLMRLCSEAYYYTRREI